MINIPLTDLTKESIYSASLQTIEDVCYSYQLESQFGVLSMANQVVCDYLCECCEDGVLNMNCHLDSNEVSFIYSCCTSLFSGLENYDKNHDEILGLLADLVEYNSDFKELILTFHVKPKLYSNCSKPCFAKLMSDSILK